MSRRGRRQGFFSRISQMFSGEPDTEDHTSTYSAEDFGAEDQLEEQRPGRRQSFTVERAAEIIKDLPPEVPRRSAVRIVRQTMAAAGIGMEELVRSIQRREAMLQSEIALARRRERELRNTTDEVVRSLEEQIKKAQEARETGISQERDRLARARAGFEDINKVRDFFDLPKEEEPQEAPGTGESSGETGERFGEEPKAMRRPDADDTRVIRHDPPSGEGDDQKEDEEHDR